MIWIETKNQLPPEGVLVHTKIDDGVVRSNERSLVRKEKFYFHHDMTTYVYYTPSHWAEFISECEWCHTKFNPCNPDDRFCSKNCTLENAGMLWDYNHLV